MVDLLNKTVLHGNVEEVKKLLQQEKIKDEINRVSNMNSRGVSPLMVASQIRDAGKREKMMELLLDSGADVNVQDRHGWTALMKALRDKRMDVVRFLLAKDAGLEFRNNDSATALMIACRNGDLEVVKLLLQKGAQVNNMNGSLNIKIRGEDYCEKSPLVLAVDNGHLAIVQELLNYDAKICIGRCDALVSACRKEAVAIAECLLENSTVQVNSTNSGSTPLMAACNYRLVPIIQQLLEKGAKVGYQGKYGRTALMDAVMTHKVEIVQLLLAHCRSNMDEVNLTDNNGNTALMLAVELARYQEDFKIVKMLLEKGANPKLKRRDIENSLSIALSKYEHYSKGYFSLFSDIVILLLNKGGEIDYGKKIRFPICDETFEVCKRLVEKRVDFGRLFYSGRELIAFSTFEQTRLVKVYLDTIGSSDINEPDKYGRTPLWFAVCSNNYELFELLWHHGADPQLCPFDGTPALEMLQQNKLLLAKFLQSALKSKNYKMTEFLLENGASAEKGYYASAIDLLPELDTIDPEESPNLSMFVSQQREFNSKVKSSNIEDSSEPGSSAVTVEDSSVPVPQHSGEKRPISSDEDLSMPTKKFRKSCFLDLSLCTSMDGTHSSVDAKENADANLEATQFKETETSSKSVTRTVRKRFSLVIQGIEECKQGTPMYERQKEDLKKVADILSKIGAPIQSESIKDQRRLGEYTPNRRRPRPILLEFLRSSDVSKIIAERSKINHPYSIQNYMSPEELSRNAILLKKRWSIHSETGIILEQIKIRNHSIYVDGKLHGTLNLTTNEYEPHYPSN